MTEKLMLVFSLLIFNVLKSNSSSKNYVTEKTGLFIFPKVIARVLL